MKLFSLLLAAGSVSFANAACGTAGEPCEGDDCHPKCQWKCDTPQCYAVVGCPKPKCALVCEKSPHCQEQPTEAPCKASPCGATVTIVQQCGLSPCDKVPAALPAAPVAVVPASTTTKPAPPSFFANLFAKKPEAAVTPAAATAPCPNGPCGKVPTAPAALVAVAAPCTTGPCGQVPTAPATIVAAAPPCGSAPCGAPATLVVAAPPCASEPCGAARPEMVRATIKEKEPTIQMVPVVNVAAKPEMRTVAIKAVSHCGDKVLNGDEVKVDCGGSCSPCSLRTPVFAEGTPVTYTYPQNEMHSVPTQTVTYTNEAPTQKVVYTN